MSHDIHQYYFERYLRNEMPVSDRITFEEKLSADMALRQAFEDYKRHRTARLEELVREHEASRKNSRLNSIIYLLISVIGIALSVNLYLDNRELRHQRNRMRDEQPKVSFWERIPFIGGQTDKEQSPQASSGQTKKETAEVPTGPADTVAVQEEPGETNELPFATDQLLHDTFVTAYDRDYFSRAAADTLTADSATRKVVKQGRKTGQHNYFIEFWQSPINYYGYKFSGHKIQLYGITAPFAIYLIIDEDRLILQQDGQETILSKDNDFHKF